MLNFVTDETRLTGKQMINDKLEELKAVSSLQIVVQDI